VFSATGQHRIQSLPLSTSTRADADTNYECKTMHSGGSTLDINLVSLFYRAETSFYGPLHLVLVSVSIMCYVEHSL
jgi:hypothetical protein